MTAQLPLFTLRDDGRLAQLIPLGHHGPGKPMGTPSEDARRFPWGWSIGQIRAWNRRHAACLAKGHGDGR